MQWYSLSINLVGKLAWPLVIVVLLVIVRTELRAGFASLLQRISSVDVPGASFKFAEAVSEARDKLLEATPEILQESTAETTVLEKVQRGTVGSFPSIGLAVATVDSALAPLAATLTSTPRDLASLADELADAGAIERSVATAIKSLTRYQERYEAHPGVVGADTVSEIMKLAQNIIQRLPTSSEL